MKITSFLFLTPLCLLSSFAEAQDMVFERETHQSAHIVLSELTDSVVCYDFAFRNDSDKPLKIKDILSSAGCTATAWSTQEYPPHSTGVIRFLYNPYVRREAETTLLADIYTNSLGERTPKGVYSIKLHLTVEGEHTPLEPHYLLEQGNGLEANTQSTADVYDTILGRIIENLQSEHTTVDDKAVAQLVSTLRMGGYWEHIDYESRFRTNWEPVEHLNNLKTLALAYVTPSSIYCGAESLFVVINDALTYWNNKNPRSHNWWFNQIGGSRVLAEVLVLLTIGNETIAPELMQELSLKLAQSDPHKWTGANKLDIARHHLYRGCVLKNDSIVKEAAEEAFYPVHITREEGIQEDMSYQQHGAHLYIGGYGIVFCEGISEMAYLLQGTPYALPEEKLACFSQFMREGFLPVFRGGEIDWSVTGRGISREGVLQSSGLVTVFNRMLAIDSTYSNTYTDAIERFGTEGRESYGVVSQNIAFWRSDYMVHNRPHFQATVHTASTRCRKTESGNGENLLGGYLSDGAFTIRQKGDEYLDIFALWEWDKIPGVTSITGGNPIGVEWGAPGTSTLTAGVSDGTLGAYAYKHDDNGFKATKSWFFWDDMVVALGCGIEGDGIDLHTTLEQSHLRSNVSYMEQQVTHEIYMESVNLDSPTYVVHDKMAYIPLESGVLHLKADNQKGNWMNINYNERNAEIEAPIFNLVWQHPKEDKSASYSYIQLPNCNNAVEIKQAKERFDVTNTPALQALYCRETECAMVLFYQEGEYCVGKWVLHVDRPALLLISGLNGKQLTIDASNPLGDSADIVLDISYRRKKVSKVIETDDLKITSLEVIL